MYKIARNTFPFFLSLFLVVGVSAEPAQVENQGRFLWSGICFMTAVGAVKLRRRANKYWKEADGPKMRGACCNLGAFWCTALCMFSFYKAIAKK